MKIKTITYKGKFISSNPIKGSGWYKSKKEIDHIKSVFSGLILEAYLPKMKRVRLEVDFWSRHDTDNIFFMGKFLIDQIVRAGKLPDDTKKYFDFVSYRANKELKNNTIIFKIYYET